MTHTTEEPVRRDNSNDALFGSILVIEATMRAVVEHLSMRAPEERTQLTNKVRELLEPHTFITRFGTGQQQILEGVAMSFSRILDGEVFGPA